jgi:tetratricopeptide (TPR) repeat protein
MKLNSLFGIFKKSKGERIETSESEVNSRNDSGTSDAKTFIDSGIAKAKSKDYLGALQAFDTAIRIEPENANAYLERSKVKSTLKDHKGAERDINQAGVLIEQLDIGCAAYDSGVAKYDSADYEGAINEFDNALKHGFVVDGVYYVRGLAKKAIDDFNGAFEDFNMAIERNPCYAEAFYDRGLIKSHKLDDNEGALEDYNRALELKPTYVDALFSRSTLKDDADAAQDLSEAIRLEPTDARLYFYRGLKRYGMGEHEGAIQDLSAFIDLAPTDSIASISEAYSLRGSMRAITKDFPAAIQDQSKAIELDPSCAKAFFERGVDRDLLKDHQGAILDFSKVIELDPSNAEAYHSRGLARLELGLEDEGRKDLIDAIGLGYEEE